MHTLGQKHTLNFHDMHKGIVYMQFAGKVCAFLFTVILFQQLLEGLSFIVEKTEKVGRDGQYDILSWGSSTLQGNGCIHQLIDNEN